MILTLIRYKRAGHLGNLSLCVCLLSLACICQSSLSASETSSTVTGAIDHPWEKSRDPKSFQSLLKHSPFSLPTAEDSSPLADRYALTGIVTINGEDQVFVFDRTDQSRELVGKIPNAKNMSLVSLIREGNATPQKASIMIGSESGTIGFLEAKQPQGGNPAAPVPGSVAAGLPGSQNPQQGGGLPQLPPLPQLPQAQQTQQPTQPGRRIIRRPMIQAPQSQSSTP
jgi:hypothetical protein